MKEIFLSLIQGQLCLAMVELKGVHTVSMRDEISIVPYLFQRSNIVSSNSEHISFGPFECRATPEIAEQNYEAILNFNLVSLLCMRKNQTKKKKKNRLQNIPHSEWHIKPSQMFDKIMQQISSRKLIANETSESQHTAAISPQPPPPPHGETSTSSPCC